MDGVTLHCQATLDFQVTRGEMTSALWRYQWRTRPGRVRAAPAVVPAAAVIALLAAVGVLDASAPGLVAAVLIVAAVVCGMPALWAVQAMPAIRGQGPVRMEVGPEGVRISAAHASSAGGWREYPWYWETGSLFVLGGDAGRFHVLPKRALAGADDVARLRELLAAHTEHR